MTGYYPGMKLIDIDAILNDPMLHTWKKKDLIEALKNAPAVEAKSASLHLDKDQIESAE